MNDVSRAAAWESYCQAAIPLLGLLAEADAAWEHVCAHQNGLWKPADNGLVPIPGYEPSGEPAGIRIILFSAEDRVFAGWDEALKRGIGWYIADYKILGLRADLELSKLATGLLVLHECRHAHSLDLHPDRRGTAAEEYEALHLEERLVCIVQPQPQLELIGLLAVRLAETESVGGARKELRQLVDERLGLVPDSLESHFWGSKLEHWAMFKLIRQRSADPLPGLLSYAGKEAR